MYEIIFIFILVPLLFFFIIGLIILFIGKKKFSVELINTGYFIAGIPAAFIIIAGVIVFLEMVVYAKPDKEDLIGKYEIVEANGVDIEEEDYHKYKLRFYKNGRFTMTHTPYIDMCEKGSFDLDYEHEINEILFLCAGSQNSKLIKGSNASSLTTNHIDRSLNGFRIEFIIDDNVRIYYGRVNEQLNLKR